MSLWRLLGLNKLEPRQEPAEEGHIVLEIAAKLDQLEASEARYIACFSYILNRVAHADLEISPEEVAQMETIVREQGGLPESQSVLVVQMAKTHNRLFGATDNYLVTREFNRIATRSQKLELMGCLLTVSASHGGISTAEDAEMRQITKELLLSHRDFIALRSRFRDHLNVLRRIEE
ncbi:MAG: TerB family tellurite resistance protein [Candidatus Aminicenantes bacterium]|nr:TerB family tellurite resistance protein [Candidatus Aminicenantes bacterium]